MYGERVLLTVKYQARYIFIQFMLTKTFFFLSLPVFLFFFFHFNDLLLSCKPPPLIQLIQFNQSFRRMAFGILALKSTSTPETHWKMFLKNICLNLFLWSPLCHPPRLNTGPITILYLHAFLGSHYPQKWHTFFILWIQYSALCPLQSQWFRQLGKCFTLPLRHQLNDSNSEILFPAPVNIHTVIQSTSC